VALYKIAAAANRDLNGISEYIMEDNPRRAISFVDEIIARFSTIAERPHSFPNSDDLPPHIRSALHDDYRILFRVVDGVPEILRVVHGARDIENLF
jgi:plasmid stabilization system protein ParE